MRKCDLARNRTREVPITTEISIIWAFSLRFPDQHIPVLDELAFERILHVADLNNERERNSSNHKDLTELTNSKF